MKGLSELRSEDKKESAMWKQQGRALQAERTINARFGGRNKLAN